MIYDGELTSVNLQSGTLLGRDLEFVNGKKIRAFLGIPYAIPPIGEYRWKPALPCRPIEGERLADVFSPSPMQQFIYDKASPFYVPELPISEDCLYLNIWAPSINDIKTCSCPVMVWFYGGGLVSGMTASPLYDGAELARKGVVVVTVNYRLGIFGFFSHPLLSQESPFGASGNYGTTDQIQALKWIKDNIGYFGGDGNNVTIFGESAGALSVSHLMASKLSKGLFNKAIMQSPYLPAMPALSKSVYGFESAEKVGLRFAENLMGPHDNLEALIGLRDLPAKQLLSAVDGFEFDKTIIDDYVFSEQIFETFDKGGQSDVPLIVGFNQDEGSYFTRIGLIDEPISQDEYRRAVASKYGDLSESYLQVYPDSNLINAANNPLGDGLYKWAAESFAIMMDNVVSNAYLYCFNHITKYGALNDLGAYHSSDIPFCFNNIKHKTIGISPWLLLSPSQADKEMGNTLSDFWVAFAHYGIPKVNGLEKWPPYSSINSKLMIFSNGSCRASEVTGHDTFSLHNSIVASRKKKNQNWTYRNIGLLAPDVE